MATSDTMDTAREPAGLWIGRGGFAVACLVALLGVPPARADVQTPGQRSCLAAMSRGSTAVAKAEGREIVRCLRAAGDGALSGAAPFQACAGADARGRLARAEARAAALEAGHCGERPGFGFTHASNVASAARSAPVGLAIEELGAGLDAAVLGDASGRRCQRALVRDAERVLEAGLRSFGACQRRGLRDGSIASRSDLESCLGALAGGAGTPVGRAAGRLARHLASKCEGADPSVALPGTCSGAADVASCLVARARCQACKAIAQASDLSPACDEVDDGLANGSCEMPYPQLFANLLALPRTGTTYYVAAEEPCASDANDGLAPTCSGPGTGPWRTFAPLAGVSLAPGDAVALRQGTYALGQATATIRTSGTPTEPIRFFAYAGEAVVLDGGWPEPTPDPAADRPVLRMQAAYTIVEGLEIRGCNLTCVLVPEGGDHSILLHNRLVGGGEDGIKSSHAKGDLIYANEFTAFHNEALDLFATRDDWVVGNEFHANDTSLRQPSSTMWAKAGSEDIHVVGNWFHDLTVSRSALILGGCCWKNWDDEGGLLMQGGVWVPQPVARQVHALSNTLERVSTDRSVGAPTPGALSVQGCHDCEARSNVIRDVDDAISMSSTRGTSQPCFAGADCDADPASCTCTWEVPAERVTIAGNRVEGVRASAAYGGERRIFNLGDPGPAPVGLSIDENLYCVDAPATFRIGGPADPSIGFSAWQAAGYDAASTLVPEAACGGGSPSGAFLDGPGLG